MHRAFAFTNDRSGVESTKLYRLLEQQNGFVVHQYSKNNEPAVSLLLSDNPELTWATLRLIINTAVECIGTPGELPEPPIPAITLISKDENTSVYQVGKYGKLTVKDDKVMVEKIYIADMFMWWFYLFQTEIFDRMPISMKIPLRPAQEIDDAVRVGDHQIYGLKVYSVDRNEGLAVCEVLPHCEDLIYIHLAALPDNLDEGQEICIDLYCRGYTISRTEMSGKPYEFHRLIGHKI